MKHSQTAIKKTPLLIAVLFMAFLGFSLVLVQRAQAATFAQAFVRLDTLKATTLTGGRVCATTTASAITTAATVRVTFPTTAATDYVLDTQASGNWSVNTTGLDTGQTAWPSIAAATAVSGKTVTFTSGANLSASTTYCFNFGTGGTKPLTTSSAGATETTPGTVAVWDSGASLYSTNFSESIITDDTVVFNAVVPPSFAFVLSGNTDNFTSNLSTGSLVSTSGRTVTITTNAASGWIVWAKDLNSSSGKGSLQSATAGNYKVAGSVAPGSASRTFSNGTEDYGLGVTINTDASGGGTVALDSNYDGSSSKAGTLDPTQFRPLATASGTANGDIISLYGRATIAGQTPAANDYTDTMTVIGAGVF